MTPTALRDLILALPDGHPAKAAFLAAEDVACAEELRKPTLPGYIPRRHLVVTLARYAQVDGLLKWVIQFGEMPAPMGGGPVNFGLYCLFQSISRIAANDVGVLLVVADLDAALPQIQPLIDLGAIPQAFIDDLKAGEVLVPLVESVSVTDVGNARNLGG